MMKTTLENIKPFTWRKYHTRLEEKAKWCGLLEHNILLIYTVFTSYLIRMIWFRNSNFGDSEVRTCCAGSRVFYVDCLLNLGFCFSFNLHEAMKRLLRMLFSKLKKISLRHSFLKMMEWNRV